MNNIYLVGFMGAGKSAVSRELHQKLGWKTLDTDQLIVEQEGIEISDIFAKKGEGYFRQVERDVVKKLTNESHLVVACGGGVATKEENQAEIKKGGTVVLLSASPETILERVSRNNKRPLLEGKKTVEDIQKFLDERQPFYEKVADITVNVDGKTLEAIAEEILSHIDL